MTYKTALRVLQQAAKYLEEEDGNISTIEHQIHLSALTLAYERVKQCN